MLYHILKISHILSAALLLTSMAYSFHLWRLNRKPIHAESIQSQTWIVIIPFAVLQLATGFTMISLKHEDMSQLWISGSVIGFIVVIASWLTFVYFLLSGHSRKLQATLLTLCTSGLLCMVFLMANKIA
ncbi:MAG: DUF2269 family protein [Gammaproteobacteria bacterium]